MPLPLPPLPFECQPCPCLGEFALALCCLERVALSDDPPRPSLDLCPNVTFSVKLFMATISVSSSAVTDHRKLQLSSVTQLCSTLCDPMDCSTPGLPVRDQLPEFPQTHVHQVSDAVQPSHPLSSIFPSIRVFSNESVLLIRWLKYWSFSFNITLPMNIQD